MSFRIHDFKYASRLWLYNDDEIQFLDHEAIVPDRVAYRIARMPHEEDEFLLEQKRVPFDPKSWQRQKKVIWSGNVSTANGFGMVAENTIKQLLKLGCRALTPGGPSGNKASGSNMIDDIVLQAIGQDITPNCLEIQHVQPPAFQDTVVERIWMYTMFETTHIPKSWVPMLNQAERILVPSSWLVQSWQEQGVTKPISVIGHGIDPDYYYYLEREERETFTFLHYGQLGVRKGTDLVTRAFLEEFRGDPNVKLVFKNIHPYFPKENLANVEYISATYSKQEMLALLQRVDCMVFPTHGEGFGLPPFEAMATGLPTIVTNWSGPADFGDPADTLLLDYTMERSDNFDVIYEQYYEDDEDAGFWAEPDYDDLKRKMRWAYEHRAAAKAMGKHAAERIAKDWTWQVQIQKLYNLIDREVNQN